MVKSTRVDTVYFYICPYRYGIMVNETIKQARKGKKLSQEQLCKAIGMSIDRYSKFENGEGWISSTELTDCLNELDLVIGPAKSLTLDQTIITKIKELNELV